MEELIKISEREGRQVVSARELYTFLEASERFLAWTKRMFKYGFIENVDYQGCKVFNTLANQELDDYALTLDCAKEISMLQRSEKGKIARQYFIACEKKLIEIAKPLSQIDMLVQSALLLKEQEQRISTVEEKVKELDVRTQTRPNYFTIVGYGSLNGISVNLQMASRLGRRAAVICKQRGIEMDEIPDPRFGKVRMYPIKVLEEVFAQPV